jgi:RNA polymerase primary sigma factor
MRAYLQDVARHRVMSSDEERRRAGEIASLRAAYWGALLSHPPLAEAIVDVLGRELPAEARPARPVLKRLSDAARQLRDRPTKVHRENYGLAMAALANELTYADPECLVADRIAADAAALVAGGAAVLLQAPRTPPRGSQRFREYAARITRASAALQAAKGRFVKANLRLVLKMAQRYRSELMPFQDVVQEGNLGLMKAVDRFDVRRGFRFSTYASWWIRHAITRATVNKARTIRLPAHLVLAHARVARARQELAAELGRAPDNAEVAARLSMPPAQVELIDEAWTGQPTSLDAASDDAPDGRAPADQVADPDSSAAHDRLEASAVQERLTAAFQTLSPIEIDILRHRFGLDESLEQTLAEVGEDHALSRERIRQLQDRALSKLRRLLEEEGIRGP